MGSVKGLGRGCILCGMTVNELTKITAAITGDDCGYVRKMAVRGNLHFAFVWTVDGGHIYKLEIPYTIKNYDKNCIETLYGEMEQCLGLNRVKIHTEV
jgi:hypothetical protein